MVKVAKNLHKRQYSLREKGRVVGYASTLTLQHCTFEVNETTRQRVMRRGQKEVHAFVVGDRIADQPVPAEAVQIGYNPFLQGQFFRKDSGAAIQHALEVYFTPQGVFALGVS
ncbi:hypothetical protein GCM10008938_30570 [Deinococcus roseus]|uniref:Uncharacterized protein n=2 Tax=Deinococcus roseus TaxID=392414 RepID=A0ABQ2D1X7_9DEIO|nr:hypothetical protein GCM10008938_30570 [Deinococcus roseus]